MSGAGSGKFKIFVGAGTDTIKGGASDDIITISSSGQGDADTIDGHTGTADVLALSTGTHTFNDNNKLKNQTNIKTFDATEFPLNLDQPYDLVFVDPPYRKLLGEAAIRSALASNWISNNALIVLEEGEQKSSLKGFKLEDIRQYGDTILHFFRRAPI